MRTFCYIVSVSLGVFLFGSCAVELWATTLEHGIGFGPEPWTSLRYLGALIGICLVLTPVRHRFRARID